MFLALRDLRRSWQRFVLVGSVVALVAVLSTVLAGLANGLVTDGISGLRTLPLDHLAFETGAQSMFSRSTLDPKVAAAWAGAEGIDSSPLGVSFVNANAAKGGQSLDLALFGVPADSFLVDRPEARRALAGKPGIVLAAELENEGVKVGDTYTLGGSGVKLPVLGFTFAGSYGHAPIAFTSLRSWQQVAYGSDARGRFSAVAIRVTNSTGSKNLAKIAAATNTEVKTKAAAYAGSPGYSAETATMTLIRAFLLVISALIVGAFFTVLTVQRTRQIGLMRALGASTWYVLRDGIGQIAVVVVAASLVGAAIGAALTALLERSSAPVSLSLQSVITSAGLLIVTGIAGSLVAFRRITKVEPSIALGVES